MAEVLLSPGVLARENDNTFLSAQPVQAGAAILGPTVKGPVGIPTVVTSFSDYKNQFGCIVESGSAEYTYFTSISAYNYFQQGGDSLLVTRVVSGSYTSATSSIITNNVSVTGGVEATGSATLAAQFVDGHEARIAYGGITYRFVASANPIPEDDVDGNLYFFSTGSSAAIAANNLKNEINSALSGALASSSLDLLVATTASAELILSASAVGTTFNGITLSTGSASDFSTQITLAGGVNGTGNSNAFTLETLTEGAIANSTSPAGSNGTLTSGSKDNLRWEIVEPNTSKGTFNLLVRRGDDTQTSKTVLETWTDLSLDPNASNYIEKVIGNSKQVVTTDGSDTYVKNEGTYNTLSRYVRVKSVSTPTLNYFDNNGDAKNALTSSIPQAGSGSFGDAVGTAFATITGTFYDNIGSNTQGLVADNYTTSINLLANKDAYSYNVITAPGLTRQNHASPLTTLVNNAQTRGDNLAVIDLREYNSTLTLITAGASAVDSSYASTYWPWLQTLDPDTGQQVWVPASTMIPGVYAFNDRAGEAWFAPAGLNRGGLSTVLRTERALTNGNRDTLYQANINPIATFPNTGVVVFGQKTLQKKASALDRVNVRRLLIALKNYISQIADNLVFEQNTIATRNNFLSQVNPYLESVQQRQGLYAFKVVMDESNNTPDVIDRNQLVGQIFIQPTRTAEFIYLDFNVQPTGATFDGAGGGY
jgi:phage tail sheath protein FI